MAWLMDDGDAPIGYQLVMASHHLPPTIDHFSHQPSAIDGRSSYRFLAPRGARAAPHDAAS
jgi:hypothetical protein